MLFLHLNHSSDKHKEIKERSQGQGCFPLGRLKNVLVKNPEYCSRSFKQKFIPGFRFQSIDICHCIGGLAGSRHRGVVA